MMREAPLGHDRAAARDDAGDAVGGERHVGQPHAGVDGEVVDALLALLDERVLVDLPCQLDGIAVALLQRLVDRHGADGHRRVADDPLARRMDVAPGAQVHHRVGAPADRPHHLLDLLLDRRGDGRVADIGVDLHEEVAADDHRLQLAVIDVGGDDGAAARDLVAHELRRDVRGDVGAETLAVGERELGAGEHGDAAEILAVRDVGHLLGDDAGARVLELRDGLAGNTAERLRLFGKVAGEMARRYVAVVLGPDRATFVLLNAAALDDPSFAQARQPARHVNFSGRIGVGSGRIIGAERRLAALLRQRDLAQRHAQVGEAFGCGIHLAGGGQRARCDLRQRQLRIARDLVHASLRSCSD